MPSTRTALDPAASIAVTLAVVPPLLLAVAGLVHPMVLDADTAAHWQLLHLGLLPVFPLLGLAPWLASSRQPEWLRVLVAVLGFVYAVWYGALDVLAGVGTGTLVLAGQTGGLQELFTIGNQLSYVGVAAYLAAALLVGGTALRDHRLAALPAVLLVVAGSLSFLTSHIYWPRGVLTMLALAAGWTWLVVLDRRGSPTERPRAASV